MSQQDTTSTYRVTTPTIPTTKQAEDAGYHYYEAGLVAAHTIEVSGRIAYVGEGNDVQKAWSIYREIHPSIATLPAPQVRKLSGAFMRGFDAAWREHGSPRATLEFGQ